MRTDRATMMRAMTLVVGLGLGLAAATAPAALVTVSGSETWDGTANPHAADGVTLSTNTTVTPNVFTYTIPDGMRITAGGSVNLGSSGNGFVFAFTGGQLQIDPGGIFNVGRTVTKSGNTPLTLDLGGAPIVGGGEIKNNGAVGTRVLTITNVADITLSAIDMSVQDSARGTLTIRSTGAVTVGLLGNYDVNTGGSSAGHIDVRAESITVSNVYTYAARANNIYVNNGDVTLRALAAPGYRPDAAGSNDHLNVLTLQGRLDTLGGRHALGNVLLSGVQVVLGPAFTNDVPTNAVFNVYTGYGSEAHFSNASAVSVTPQYIISHQEHTNPAVIIDGVELWNGAVNPREGNGVTLTTNASAYVYTIPKPLHILYGGRLDMGGDHSRGFEYRFTGGDLQIDRGGIFDIGVNGVRYPTLRTVVLDLGGASITADPVSGGGAIRNAFTAGASAEYGGTRELLITNVNHVTLDTLSCVAEDATHGPLRVSAAGTVTVNTLDNSDPNAGGSSARDITVRASQIDVRTVSAYVGRSTGAMVNGDILLEALAPPAYDYQRPVQTKANTLVARGLIRTRGGSDAFTKGNVTLRAAVLTLETGFATNIAPSGVYANFAGDATPESTYFVVLSNNGTFTATHNVQLKPPPGTMIAIR